MDNFQCKRITPIRVNYKKKNILKNEDETSQKIFLNIIIIVVE